MSGLFWGLAAGGTALGCTAWAVHRLTTPPKVQGVPVLRYRLVGSPRPGSPLNDLRVPISKFEAQIRHLRRRGFMAVPLEDALAKRHDPGFLRKNPIALTFDGPYASFATAVWPILRRFGLERVTLFYPPGRLGQTEMHFAEGRPEPTLDLETLAKLTRRGVSLGVQMGNFETAKQEQLVSHLAAGRKALRAVSQQEVATMILPFPTPAALAAVRDVGFAGAGLIGDGVLTHRTHRFSIPRFPIQPNTSLLEVALVVSRRMGNAIW